MTVRDSERICRCHVCVPGNNLAEGRQVIVDHVGAYGWHVAGLLADAVVPGWAYSIGLWHSFGVPELCMFGLCFGCRTKSIQ